MAKIVSIDDFVRPDAIIVHCHGCFDLVHAGHVAHLQKAKTLGDILIVSVTSDPFVNKGVDRPVYKLEDRMKILSALACVDYVIPSHANSSLDIILEVKPDYYVKGIDYIDTKVDIEREAVERLGGEVIFTNTPKQSTTDIIRRIRREN